MKDKKKCQFTGTTNKVSVYNLGSSKQINCKIKTTKNGAVNRPEDLKLPTWQVSQKDFQLIKDYQISVEKGQVEVLPSEELKKSSFTFKSWNSPLSEVTVECRGECSHGEVTATGAMQVRRVRGVFAGIVLRKPLIGGMAFGEYQLWHLTLRLQGQVELEEQPSANGTVGILNLVRAKRTARQGTVITTILDTQGDFILHTYGKDHQDPVLDLKKITNGLVSEKNTASKKLYQLDFPLNQFLKTENHSYHFDDTVRNYFFFKGNQTSDIWHPIGMANNTANLPSYIEWSYQAELTYKDKSWQFTSYQQVDPHLAEVTSLPEWNKNIWS